MKRKKKNDNDNIIYNQIGISQAALAQYVGAKTSTLSHHLAGTRLLPGEAGLKLVNLIVKLVRLPQQPIVPRLSAEERKELQQAADWCRTQCIPLQKKLETMKTEATKAARMLQFAALLQKEETEMTDTRQRWYDGRQAEANYKLVKFGTYQQALLQAKMAALQAEAEIYEARLMIK